MNQRKDFENQFVVLKKVLNKVSVVDDCVGVRSIENIREKFYFKLVFILFQKIAGEEKSILWGEMKHFKKKSYFKNITFLDAFAGTGKTWIGNNLLSICDILGIESIAVASSGIASTILLHGQTLHSQFKVPIPVYERSVCNLNKERLLKEKIRLTQFIFMMKQSCKGKNV